MDAAVNGGSAVIHDDHEPGVADRQLSLQTDHGPGVLLAGVQRNSAERAAVEGGCCKQVADRVQTVQGCAPSRSDGVRWSSHATHSPSVSVMNGAAMPPSLTPDAGPLFRPVEQSTCHGVLTALRGLVTGKTAARPRMPELLPTAIRMLGSGIWHMAARIVTAFVPLATGPVGAVNAAAVQIVTDAVEPFF